MTHRFFWFILAFFGAFFPRLHAGAPPLLSNAIERWVAGSEDLAFTQQTRFFGDDGRVKKERIERFDPSLPDSQRWRLVEVDGQPATDEQRKKWESSKNRNPRKKVVKSPTEYLDLDNARLVANTPKSARFEIGLRPVAMRLLAVDDILVAITVDKGSGGIVRISATLRQPISVLLGLARITDLDVDVRIQSVDKGSAQKSGEFQIGSTARVTVSKLGNPMEYNWSDFKRVTSFGKSKQPS
jgi:hypothetical protein